MENQEARKQIEAGLGQFFLRYRHAFLSKVWDRIITHLAEEVIVVETFIRHTDRWAEIIGKDIRETLVIQKGYEERSFYLDGIHGIPGKALCIIISQEPQ